MYRNYIMSKKKKNNVTDNSVTDNSVTDNINPSLKDYIAKCEGEYKAAIKSWSCKAMLDTWTRLKRARAEYNEQMNIKDKKELTDEKSS